MKILVIYENQTIETLKRLKLKSEFDYYLKYIRDNNEVKFHEDEEYMYYEVDIDIIPNIGQRVGTRLGNMIVTHSLYNLEVSFSKSIFCQSYIVVKEE